MIREFVRHVVVAFVAVCLAASLVAGVHLGSTTTIALTEPTLQASGPDPSLQIVMERRNITTNNSTSFVAYVGNPQDSDRSMYVMVRVRIRVIDRSLHALVRRDPGTRFGDHLVWEFDFDLDPGEYRLVYGSVGRHSDPGTYPIEISANYWREDGFVSRSSVQEVRINSLPPDYRSWWERTLAVLGAIVAWMLGWIADERVRIFLGVLAALATILAFVVQLLGRDRVLARLRREERRQGKGTDERDSDESR